MSQAAVAGRLGCSANVYARYERGERQPSIEVLVHMSEIFGVSVDFLIGNHEMEISGLSKYEVDLIREARSADERSREDALLLLHTHKALDLA